MTNPVIDDFDPARGSTIESDDSISFSITDADSGGVFSIIVVAASFQNEDGSERVDIIHDGDVFRVGYVSSTRLAITNGWRYTVVREGGWPSTPKIEWFVVDEDGLGGQA